MLAETLAVCWRRRAELPGDVEAALPWAYGVARLQLANAERSRRRRMRLAAKVAATQRPAEEVPAPDGPDLSEVLASLPAADAELLRLWAWEQLEPREIAVVLQISANAASIRLHRARQKFRDQWRKDRGDGGHEGAREGGGR